MASNLHFKLYKLEARSLTQKRFDIDWGIFSLVEFIVSSSDQIGSRYKTAIDIGSGAGIQTEILRAAGLEVFQLDKYSDKAEYKVDFISHNFDQKFDIVYCSHVIEHQRNVGNFLDKIFDVMSDDGLLLISAPKHPAEDLINGHLNCFYSSYFIQQLIHAGFDLKNGKYLSCAHIENAAIVSKARNFELSEREEAGHIWTEKHQERSYIELVNQEIQTNVASFQNCTAFYPADTQLQFDIHFPEDYKSKAINVGSKRHGFNITM